MSERVPARLTPAKITAHMRAAINAAFAEGATDVTVDYHGLRLSAHRAARSNNLASAEAALDAWERDRA